MVDMNFNTRTRSKKLGPIGSIFFVLLGLGMLWGAVYFGLKTEDLLAHGVRTQGQVTDVIQKMETKTTRRQGYTSTSQRLMFYPVVTFDDKDKHSVTFQSNTGSSSPQHNKGDTVPVIYLENSPATTAIIDEGWQNWLLPGILGAMGLIFSLVGAFSFLRALVI